MPEYVSFGLLHRIPPQSIDRTPGGGPIELQDQYEGRESDLFIPADARAREESISHYLDGPGHSSRSESSLEQNGRS